MKKAIYPGSFNPWHLGHEDILMKALKVFDKVVVVQLKNSKKNNSFYHLTEGPFEQKMKELQKRFPNLEYVGGLENTLIECIKNEKADAVIRGLRDGDDLSYERRYQYWNEDMGVEIPFTYFVADRKYNHVSSSAIREVEGLGFKHNY